MASWRAIGRIPSTAVVVAMLVGALLGVLLLSEEGEGAVGLVLLAGFVLHCVARPSHGGDVFAIALLPSFVSFLASEIFDISRQLVGWPLLAVALVLLWQLDRRHPASA